MEIRYIIIFIVMFVVVLLSEYLTYLAFHTTGILGSKYIEWGFMIFGFLFPMLFVFSMLNNAKHFSLADSWLYTASATWLGIIIYTFAATVITALLIYTNNYFLLDLPIKFISLILFICALLVSAYGVYNASKIKIVHFTINSSTLSPLWQNKKIVAISDTHLGNVRQEKFMEKVVQMIKSENPDIVFVLGDLIDGTSLRYDQVFAPLSELSPKLGSQYVEGNHERYSGEYEVFRSKFPKSLNDLTNKKEIINGTQIIGIDYAKSRSPEEIKSELIKVGYDPKIPSIILMHDPEKVETLAESNVSLVLSGHTHAGQIFPFTILLNWKYGKHDHGVSYIGKTALMTSSGVGTAMVPMRIGTNPEIVVIDIK